MRFIARYKVMEKNNLKKLGLLNVAVCIGLCIHVGFFIPLSPSVATCLPSIHSIQYDVKWPNGDITHPLVIPP